MLWDLGKKLKNWFKDHQEKKLNKKIGDIDNTIKYINSKINEANNKKELSDEDSKELAKLEKDKETLEKAKKNINKNARAGSGLSMTGGIMFLASFIIPIPGAQLLGGAMLIGGLILGLSTPKPAKKILEEYKNKVADYTSNKTPENEGHSNIQVLEEEVERSGSKTQGKEVNKVENKEERKPLTPEERKQKYIEQADRNKQAAIDNMEKANAEFKAKSASGSLKMRTGGASVSSPAPMDPSKQATKKSPEIK
ncbi:MAG: hypothetical protein J0H68_01000 [Sphingobacteriia bacterium]|nr:hypothetical protein [Sphingobacteriia bacterium]